MVVPLRLLPLAWLAVALTGPIPWLTRAARDRTWVWESWFFWIIASHLMTALCPFLVGLLLWRRHDWAASGILVLVAANALLEQVFLFHLFHAVLSPEWFRGFLPHNSLAVLTLGVVGAHAFKQSRGHA